jgi:phenylpyruvate tautomerase PptA (4-oxalocrotonate tautomerase family)
MPLIEVFLPKDTIEPDKREELSKQLVAEVMRTEGVPNTDAGRSISWLLWHEIDGWWVGQDRVSASDPRYVVRVGVPEGAMDDAKRAAIIQSVTAVLAKSEDDPSRLEREPAAFVIIDELRDGNLGAMGRVTRFSDIKQLLGASQ